MRDIENSVNCGVSIEFLLGNGIYIWRFLVGLFNLMELKKEARVRFRNIIIQIKST